MHESWRSGNEDAGHGGCSPHARTKLIKGAGCAFEMLLATPVLRRVVVNALRCRVVVTVISDENGSIRSPQARATSPSVPRGTKLIVCIPPGFLLAGFTSFEDYTVCILTQTPPKVTILRLPGTSVVLSIL